MEKRILNLTEKLFAVVKAEGDERDHRFESWAKVVTGVDTSKSNGYAFVGPFVKDGTVEIEVKPTLYIVMTAAGSMKYHTATYRVVVLDATGEFEATGINATDKTPGWALRIRDSVAAKLAEINQPTEVTEAQAAPQTTMTRAEAAQGATELVRTLREVPILGNQEPYLHLLDVLQSFVDILA